MCFSAQASFAAATILSAIGLFTVSKVRTKALLPLATIPVFFGIQQMGEGVVWLTLNAGDTTSMMHKIAVYGFVFFASMFWPLWIPGSLYLVEQHKRSKQLLGVTFVIGLLFALVALKCLIVNRITAHIVDHHIGYSFFAKPFSNLPPFYQLFVERGLLVAYLIPVVLSFFISCMPYAWVSGLLITIAYVLARVFYTTAFGSVWCFFGAIISVTVYCAVRRYNTQMAKS